MWVMVIDTALGLCTAGVFEVGGDAASPLGVRSEAMGKGHQERLAGFARDAAADAGGFAGIERIGVTVGPGSFTGLRVGLAFAQGLGAALGRPVVGVSTLDALAASAGDGDVAALIDARRGQVYARFWRAGTPQEAPQALSLDAAAERVAALPAEAVLAGSGAGLLAGPAGARRILDLPGPDPAALARLTAKADPAVDRPVPLYLRAPDATPPSRLPGQPRPPRP